MDGTLTLSFDSAKELEHYHRVRRTFEGPSKPQIDTLRKPQTTRIPAPAQVDGQARSPPPSTRPKMQNRTSTIKPKPKQESKGKGKGKGKATTWNSDEDEDDDDDEAYVTSNDFATPERKHSAVNGFGDAAGDDEEELYG